jgi:vacuolar-type H+-ATPase catalytic subunit A/Vma1
VLRRNSASEIIRLEGATATIQCFEVDAGVSVTVGLN